MQYLHEFCVMPSVDHHPVHPLSVPELGSSQQDLVWTKWYCAAGRNETTDFNKQTHGVSNKTLYSLMRLQLHPPKSRGYNCHQVVKQP